MIPNFYPDDCFKLSDGRCVFTGPFPFTDNPDRDSGDVIGREVFVDGQRRRITGIERNPILRPYKFGELVGLVFGDPNE